MLLVLSIMAKRNNLGFIVEGHSEYTAFTQYTPQKYISRARRFGGKVRLETIAEEIATLARLLSTHCNKIVAVMDREDRVDDSLDIENSLITLLSRHQIRNTTVIIICPDRMFENWMLADVVACKRKKYISNRATQKHYEGTSGKNELKRLFVGKVYYQETTHGVELFKSIRQNVASNNSVSFRRFLSNL